MIGKEIKEIVVERLPVLRPVEKQADEAREKEKVVQR